MKPRKPHKRSLKATVCMMLEETQRGMNAYQLAAYAKMLYPTAQCTVQAIRKILVDLMKKGLVKKIGKQECLKCHMHGTVYKRTKLSIR